jgi:hypothetical protein
VTATAPATRRGPSNFVQVLLVLGTVGVLAAGAYLGILSPTTGLPVGTTASVNLPPTGTVWFGQSFDPDTFALTGQRTNVGTHEAVAMVAHMTKSMADSVTLRASLNGQLVGQVPVSVKGSGEIFGTVLGALNVPGEYRYDLVDVGGNVLASGTVTAR